MDINEYISSGIIERYVLGAVSMQEQQEVECMSHIYPEIAESLTQLQGSVASFAEFIAQDPPEHLRQKVLSAIENEEQQPAAENVPPMKMVREDDAGRSSGSNLKWKLAAAASIVVLVTVGVLWINKNQQVEELQQEITSLDEQKEELLQQNEQITESLSQTEQLARQQQLVNDNLSDLATKNILLEGTENSPDSRVRVFWNVDNQKVFLKVDQLPAPDASSQYQLWAIVDGDPQDMGVFEINAASTQIQPMPYAVKNAQAFAITLEKRGGSPAPNLEAMYVVGNVSA